MNVTLRGEPAKARPPSGAMDRAQHGQDQNPDEQVRHSLGGSDVAHRPSGGSDVAHPTARDPRVSGTPSLMTTAVNEGRHRDLEPPVTKKHPGAYEPHQTTRDSRVSGAPSLMTTAVNEGRHRDLEPPVTKNNIPNRTPSSKDAAVHTPKAPEPDLSRPLPEANADPPRHSPNTTPSVSPVVPKHSHQHNGKIGPSPHPETEKEKKRPANPSRVRTTSPPSLRVKRLTQKNRGVQGRPSPLSTGMILLFAAISLVSTGYTNHHVTDEPPRGGWGGYTPQSQPGAALGAQSQPRQGSLGENSLNLRYLPSDEAKDKVAPAGMGPAGTHQVHPDQRGGSGTRPPPTKTQTPTTPRQLPTSREPPGCRTDPTIKGHTRPRGLTKARCP